MDYGLEYCWAKPEDATEIQAFLVVTFGPDSVQASPDRMRWLYFDNPLGLHISVCRSQGEIVACCGHLPRPVVIEGEEVMAGFGVDFMVAKSWRRRGLGKQLLELRLQRFDLGLSIGQSPDMSALYRTMSAMDLGSLQLGIHRRNFALAGNPKSTARNLAAWWLGKKGLRPRAGDGVESCSHENVMEIVSQSSEALGRWFQWRFNGPVYTDYPCRKVVRNDMTAGYIVGRREKGTNILVEMAGLSHTRAQLLAVAGWLGPEPETRILFAGDNLARDCRRAGYLLRPHGTRLIAQSRDSGIMASLRPGYIDLMAGSADTDLLRHPPKTD